MKGLLGKKLGMTQVFTTDGTLIPVTVVEVQPNVVLQKKTKETDGYVAVQLGAFEKKAQRTTKPLVGHVTKASATPKQFIREIRSDVMANEFEVGSEVRVNLFSAGDRVDVSGISKGKGFMGAVYRHNQATGPNSHGSGFHRGPGSLATIGRNNGIINKGTGMAGQEGYLSTTNQNLEIIQVDETNNALLIKGNVPGPKRGFVVVKTTVKAKKSVDAKELMDRTKVVEAPIEIDETMDVVESTVDLDASADAAPVDAVVETATPEAEVASEPEAPAANDETVVEPVADALDTTTESEVAAEVEADVVTDAAPEAEPEVLESDKKED
jgi:large subunit ribosomal protein L3